MQSYLKKNFKHVGEIEEQLWKNNITFTPRQKKDWLDVSGEDFSKYETVDIQGNRVKPSTFNIFRDSLRKNRNEIHQRMLEHLPDMSNNKSDSEASGSDVETPVVPLDFRTTMDENGKLVIQVKGKKYTSIEEDMDAVEKGIGLTDSLDPDAVAGGDLDAYLKSLRKDAFDKDDPDVVLIDPMEG